MFIYVYFLDTKTISQTAAGTVTRIKCVLIFPAFLPFSGHVFGFRFSFFLDRILYFLVINRIRAPFIIISYTHTRMRTGAQPFSKRSRGNCSERLSFIFRKRRVRARFSHFVQFAAKRGSHTYRIRRRILLLPFFFSSFFFILTRMRVCIPDEISRSAPTHE